MTGAASPPARLALASIAASCGLALLKLAAAASSGSLALLGSALDAGIDIGVTGITYMVVRAAERPPDDDHHFGHVRLESLGAMLQTLVLIGVGGIVVHMALRQITGGAMTMQMQQAPIAVAALAVSAGVDLWRSHALGVAARRVGSAVLAAAALSFRLDCLTTLVALAGVMTARLGVRIADPIAAGVVGVVMLVSAVRLLRETVDAMTDRAPDGVADLVRAAVLATPQVQGLGAVRVRGLGARVFVELTIHVDGNERLIAVQAVKAAAVAAVQAVVPGAEVIVMAEPA